MTKGIFKTKRPRYSYFLLTCSYVVIGFIAFAIGLSAFNTTPQYRVGGFWAGLLTFLLGIYRSGVLFVKIVPVMRDVEKYNQNMVTLTIMLGILCFIANICAITADSVAIFIVQQVDFSYCSYTDVSILTPCEKPECSSVRFPRKTCYCCQIMEGLTDDCEVRLLRGRQYYYSEVDSCIDIAVWLKVKLVIVIILHAINAATTFVGVCKNKAVKPVVNEADKKNKDVKGRDKQNRQVRRSRKRNDAYDDEEEELFAEEENMRRVMGSISDNSML